MMTAHTPMIWIRAIPPGAGAKEATGNWWTDDETAARGSVALCSGVREHACQIVEAEIETAGFIELDEAGELHDPEIEARWQTYINAGAIGVLIRNVRLIEHGTVCTVLLLHPDTPADPPTDRPCRGARVLLLLRAAGYQS